MGVVYSEVDRLMGLLPAVVVELRGTISDLQAKLGQAKTELDTMQTKGESFGSKFVEGVSGRAFSWHGRVGDAETVSSSKQLASSDEHVTRNDGWCRRDEQGDKLPSLSDLDRFAALDDLEVAACMLAKFSNSDAIHAPIVAPNVLHKRNSHTL